MVIEGKTPIIQLGAFCTNAPLVSAVACNRASAGMMLKGLPGLFDEA